MFTKVIVEQVLENALNCRKDYMFKYINLEHSDIEQFANKFLEEDQNRLSCISKDDVYSFLEKNLKSTGYKLTRDGVFISPRILGNKDLFLEDFNCWSKCNPNSNYLIPNCHYTNLEVLENLITSFGSKIHMPLLERLSLDLQSIITDANYRSYEQEYERFILTLLSECTTGSIFSNILKASDHDSFKEQVYDVISKSYNRGSISIEVVSSLGVENVPSNVLQSYIEFINPSVVSTDMFLSLLNTVPLTNFTIANLDTANPVFTKYVALIQNCIHTKTVTKELITKMIQAATPDNPNGWTILSLLNQACASFSNQNNTQPISTNSSPYTEPNNKVDAPNNLGCEEGMNYIQDDNTQSTSNFVATEYREDYSQEDNYEQTSGFINPYTQYPLGENHQGFSYNDSSDSAVL